MAYHKWQWPAKYFFTGLQRSGVYLFGVPCFTRQMRRFAGAAFSRIHAAVRSHLKAELRTRRARMPTERRNHPGPLRKFSGFCQSVLGAPGNFPVLTGEVKVRTAHEVMTAWTAELALFVDQLVTTLQAKTPMFTGHIFGGHWTGIRCRLGRFWVSAGFGVRLGHCVRPNFRSSSR